MRAALRGEDEDRTFVSLAGIDTMHGIQTDGASLRIGALVTHDALGRSLDAYPAFGALATAATVSANPAIRNCATVGGNICTQNFAAPDLVPALIALHATITVHSVRAKETCLLEAYVKTRGSRPQDEILTQIQVPHHPGASAHARGLLRQAGEYPVAIVSVFAEIDPKNIIVALRIAISSVEVTPRRWGALEAALTGQIFDAETAKTAARAHLGILIPRDGVDAPGWYRARILPQLIARAFADVATQLGQGAPT